MISRARFGRFLISQEKFYIYREYKSSKSSELPHLTGEHPAYSTALSILCAAYQSANRLNVVQHHSRFGWQPNNTTDAKFSFFTHHLSRILKYLVWEHCKETSKLAKRSLSLAWKRSSVVVCIPVLFTRGFHCYLPVVVRFIADSSCIFTLAVVFSTLWTTTSFS